MEALSKKLNANLDAQTLIAPDGSSWPLTKAVFSFSQGLFIGPNLDSVILEGVNSLSIQVEGNVTISKNLIGSKPLTSPYVAAASTLDGHDSFYENNPQKETALESEFWVDTQAVKVRKRTITWFIRCRWTFRWWWIIRW